MNGSWGIAPPPKTVDGLLAVPVPLGVEHRAQTVIGLEIEVPEDAEPGSTHRVDLVRRAAETGRVTGGIAVEVHVVHDTSVRAGEQRGDES